MSEAFSRKNRLYFLENPALVWIQMLTTNWRPLVLLINIYMNIGFSTLDFELAQLLMLYRSGKKGVRESNYLPVYRFHM